MEISYSKNRQPSKHYINFRIRNIVKKFCLSKAEEMKKMNDIEKAIFISENVEELVCMEFWVKQKVKSIEQKKAA